MVSRMVWPWRVLVTLLAALLAAGTAPVAVAATVESSAAVACAYTYDVQRGVQVASPATERGPPAASDQNTLYDVGAGSRGASVRVGEASDSPVTKLAGVPVASARGAGSPAATLEHVRRIDGALASVGKSAVAAKPAVGFAEGLGKSALTPNRLQHGTKNLTNAGVLPAWSGKNSPGIIVRAFTPILEHPKATFDHSLGGTSVRGFLGDIDGTQVAVFVYKEGPYQGQLASSLVPSANQLSMWGIG